MNQILLGLALCLHLGARVTDGAMPADWPPDELLSMPGLVLLLDADHVSVTQGQAVTWYDLSGRTNDAVAPSVSNSPSSLPFATPSGRSALWFDSTTYLDVPAKPSDFDGLGKTTLAVFRPKSLGLFRVVNLAYLSLEATNPAASGHNTMHGLFTVAGGGVRAQNRTKTGSSIAVSTPTGSVHESIFVIGANRWSTNGDTLAVARNPTGQRSTGQISGATAHPGGHLVTRVGAGGSVSTPSEYFGGELAALLIFNRALDDAELQSVETLLSERYFSSLVQSYASWVDQTGLPQGNDAPADDASGDGISNLEKFFLGLDPLEYLESDPPRAAMQATNGTTYLYHQPGRSPHLSPVGFKLESSTSLTNWTAAPDDFMFLDEIEGEPGIRYPLLERGGDFAFLRSQLSLSNAIFWVPLGTRRFATTQRLGYLATSSVPGDTPALPMWRAPYANLSLPAGGLPQVTGAVHTSIWEPQNNGVDWAFNHHAALGSFDGKFHAMWSNHPQGEDAPGQRVLFATSTDGQLWSAPMELFPPPGPVLDRGNPGSSLRPDRWVMTQDRCFAVAYIRATGIITYPIAREVFANGSYGDPFTLRPHADTNSLPDYMKDSEPYWDPASAQSILDWYADNATVSWWAQTEQFVPSIGIGGASLIEPFTYRATDGETILLMRFHPGNNRHNNRMYVSMRDAEGQWSRPHPTSIPDSPSRTEAVTLPNGTILLIGNQIATLDTGEYLDRDPLTIAISSDGYVFDRVHSLRHGAPTSNRVPDIEGRALGFAYSSSLIKDGWLYSLYSVGKEDIAITRIPLSSLGL